MADPLEQVSAPGPLMILVADTVRRFNAQSAADQKAHCEAWRGTWQDEINFAGLDGDVLFAEWLLDTLAEFVRRECHNYLNCTFKPGMPRVRRSETRAFVAGCCDRIALRLHELAVAQSPAGTWLVLAKNALIATKLDELGIRLTRGRARFKLYDGRSFVAGEASGDLARFDRPVEDTAAPLAIGGRI